MLHLYLIAELLKLKRSLALLLCVAAPCCVVILNALIALDRKGPVQLPMFGIGAAAFWAFAMLPLAVTALSVLMAQMEHGPRTWDHMLTMPGARTRIFLAKALTMLGLVTAMSLLLFVSVLASGWMVSKLHAVDGAFDPLTLAFTLAKMNAAAALVCMLQLWVALRFRSFVPPLVFGIGGTFVAVAATSARQGAYFPWLMAVNVLSTEPARQQLAMTLGALGGLVALVAMLAHMRLREA
jgi:ABC-2 type transport system permease protein